MKLEREAVYEEVCEEGDLMGRSRVNHTNREKSIKQKHQGHIREGRSCGRTD